MPGPWASPAMGASIDGVAASLAGCAFQAKVRSAASPRTPSIVVGVSPYSWVWILHGHHLAQPALT